jgi:hypothetical protein
MAHLRVSFGIAVGFLSVFCSAPLRGEQTPGTLSPATERFAAPDASETPHFQKHVVPLLGRLGCNGRSCHGSFQGRGGFQLSLFGYDFQMDRAALGGKAASSEGLRLDARNPEASLILRKPTAQIDHEGGQRFAVGSWQHHLLRRWIESGAAGVEQPLVLSKLEIAPSEIVFNSQSEPVPVQVTAVWADGQREDVTPLCRFRSNNDAVASVDSSGVVTSAGPGDTHVIAFYDNGIAALPIIRRYRPAADLPKQSSAPGGTLSPIDSLVVTKLDKLGIIPSEICDDATFLRRVSIDLTGTLPGPREVESFLADHSPDKRTRKIDELLERPAYAAWWSNKLCDFTGCNPSQQAELGQETSVQWYMWIYRRLRENVPYDELVRRIVLATGRDAQQSYDDYSRQVSAYFRTEAPADFSQRETMPHYWTRRSMKKPDDAAQAFAHNFLGIRLQCAQCHKHPFASWTKDDFRQFSRFFEGVKFGVAPSSLDRYRELARETGLNLKGEDGGEVNAEVLKHAAQGRTVPWRELYIKSRSQTESISLLQSGVVTIAPDDDPRQPIMDWMNEPQNPWFAKAFVNRVWAGYFHVGIIDPPDDLNPANPPSNPALLEWLVRGFVEHDYDMKWLHRAIVNSDTYQRSWKPNETNRDDRHNFSRAVPRRLPAEVMYDAVKQALAASSKAEEVRTDLTRRAIGDLSMRLAGTYGMQVFGKPDRSANCDCERNNQPTLLQSIFQQNSPRAVGLRRSLNRKRTVWPPAPRIWSETRGCARSTGRRAPKNSPVRRPISPPPAPGSTEFAISCGR